MKTILKVFLKNAIFLVGLFCAFIGSLVIFGWFTENNLLIQVHQSFAPMQFNTALCFLFMGTGLIFDFFNQFKSTRNIFYSLVCFICLITLGEYLFDLNFGLDELFFDHYILTDTSHPGRMAPNTASCFILFSMGAIFHFNDRFKKLASLIIYPIIFLLSSIALVGYFFEVGIYKWGNYTSMAAHTAGSFFLIGLSGLLQFFSIPYSNKKDRYFEPYCFGGLSILLSVFIFLILTINFSDYQNGILCLCFGLIISIFMFITSYYTIVVDNKNEELTLNYKKLLEKNKDLERVSYVISHDLNEPLRVINSYSILLKNRYKDTFDETGERWLDFITEGASRSQRLLNHVLTINRIDNQKLHMANVSLNTIILHVRTDLSLLIRETNATINYPNLPIIFGDETQIRQLFQNILANSLKYFDPKRSLVINISYVEYPDYYKFIISDNGVGFNSEKFNPFLLFSRTSRKTGDGVGLAICDKIVNNHKGKIWAASCEGKGSTFYFTIAKEHF